MRTETIIKTYYKFDEIENEDIKTKILDKYRDINVDSDFWYECEKDDFHFILEHLGFSNIESNFSGFWSKGDGASFSGVFEVPSNQKELKERLKTLLEHYPTYFKDDTDIKKLYLTLNFQDERKDDVHSVEIYRKSSRYYHECTMFSDHEQLQELGRLLAVKYYNNLKSTYYYLTSDELVKETLINNEYEFDIDTLELA